MLYLGAKAIKYSFHLNAKAAAKLFHQQNTFTYRKNQTMTTLILKLTDGTEILATVTENPGTYFCSDILQIITDIDERGQGRMGFVDFMPYADPKAGFAVPTNMACVTMPSEELQDHYNKRFSKIITPGSKLQLV